MHFKFSIKPLHFYFHFVPVCWHRFCLQFLRESDMKIPKMFVVCQGSLLFWEDGNSSPFGCTFFCNHSENASRSIFSTSFATYLRNFHCRDVTRPKKHRFYESEISWKWFIKFFLKLTLLFIPPGIETRRSRGLYSSTKSKIGDKHSNQTTDNKFLWNICQQNFLKFAIFNLICCGIFLRIKKKFLTVGSNGSFLTQPFHDSDTEKTRNRQSRYKSCEESILQKLFQSFILCLNMRHRVFVIILCHSSCQTPTKLIFGLSVELLFK